ncbi:glycosyltransferase [Caballeronia glebae]|uniref:glycosyltransferase n=1 Tax=Caballeronia glebae TaxID=1777143 RepID=UPI0038B7EA35
MHMTEKSEIDISAASGEHGRTFDSGCSASPKTVHPLETNDARSADSLDAVIDELSRLVSAGTTVLAAQKAIAHAEDIARAHLRDTSVRFMLLKLKDAASIFPDMYAQWSALLTECPDDLRVVRYCASHLVRQRRNDEALALVDRHLPEVIEDWRAGLARAELLSDIRAHAASDLIFQRLIDTHGRREPRVAFSKRLNKRGLLFEAYNAIAPVASTLAPDSKAGQLAASIADDYGFFSQLDTAAGFQGQDIRILSLKHAILSFRNRSLPQTRSSEGISIALLTGSLGPGGAERQLTRLACHLKSMSATDGETSKRGVSGNRSNGKGIELIRDVEVIVRQFSDASRANPNHRLDFFLEPLREASVAVTEINHLPAVSIAHQHLDACTLERLLEKLPAPVRYGVTRLTPFLRERRFDVVSLWQDGTCLLGALAALLAGVPTIHLVFRGLPPNIRTDRNRPEYIVMYRALAAIPGVHFVSNSHAAAQEYARWLGLPLDRFHVLYNGVPGISTAGDESDERKWRAFANSTQDATETIGGVFRLEPDKRPLMWIKLAARYLKMRPHARFVLVGDGRLQEKVSALADELGLNERLLFAGLSSHVGFWYSKMSAKLLLSRYEGLPNVLIEAQMLGVPVLATPAGGAGECFVDDVTGHLLDSADRPNLASACQKLAVLIDSFRADGARHEYARQRARLLFSVDAMIGRFIELCAGAEVQTANEGRDDLLENSLEA